MPHGFRCFTKTFSVSKMVQLFFNLPALLSLRRSPTLSSWRSIMHFKHPRSSDLRFDGFDLRFDGFWMTKKGGSFWKSQAAKQPRLYFVLEYCDSLGVVCCFQSGLPGYCRWLVAEKFRVRKVSWRFFFDPFKWRAQYCNYNISWFDIPMTSIDINDIMVL